MEPDAFALPVYQHSKYNEAIKEIYKKALINDLVKIVSYRGTERVEEVFKKYELISSHTARKSLISLAAQSGISVDVISSVTGNSPACLSFWKEIINSALLEYMRELVLFPNSIRQYRERNFSSPCH